MKGKTTPSWDESESASCLKGGGVTPRQNNGKFSLKSRRSIPRKVARKKPTPYRSIRARMDSLAGAVHQWRPCWKKRSDANSILLNLFSHQSLLQKSAMLTIESTLSKARKKAGGVHTTLKIGKSTFCVQHRCSHTGAEIVPFNHSVYGTNTNPPSRVSKFLSSEPDSTILSSLAV